jgi:hypothetical protein
MGEMDGLPNKEVSRECRQLHSGCPGWQPEGSRVWEEAGRGSSMQPTASTAAGERQTGTTSVGGACLHTRSAAVCFVALHEVLPGDSAACSGDCCSRW